MRLFPILDQALLSQETRDAYAVRTPRVWPSEASAELFDRRESDIIGACHRKSYWRLIGEPQTNLIDVIGARRFRTGRAMELDIINLAKDAGVFVAWDPDNNKLYIVENKTIFGYPAKKKVITGGQPKLEGVMQSVILRVPSSSPSVSLRFRDLHGQVIALPCAQEVAQQFLNFLPLLQGQ
jgi:hypothetical protein